MPSMTFVPDPEVANVLAGCAAEMVKVARDRHSIDLDYSDASAEAVEGIAERFWQSRPTGPSDPATERIIVGVSNDLGGYLGETFRRNHGGEWGWVADGRGGRFPGFRTPSGALFWPTGKARNRLINGPEDNLALYYSQLVADLRATEQAPDRVPPPSS